MLERIFKLSCDWCGNDEQSRLRKGNTQSRLRKLMEKYGWFTVIHSKSGILDFCSKECYEEFKKYDLNTRRHER